jgi:hypothetical protein
MIGLAAIFLTMSGASARRRGQAEEHVGAADRVGQRAHAGVLRVALLVSSISSSAALVDHALGVAPGDVLAGFTPSSTSRSRQAMRRRAGARGDELHVADLLADQRPAVESAAAPTMIAVPCWSSWNTGIFMRSRSFFSM